MMPASRVGNPSRLARKPTSVPCRPAPSISSAIPSNKVQVAANAVQTCEGIRLQPSDYIKIELCDRTCAGEIINVARPVTAQTRQTQCSQPDKPLDGRCLDSLIVLQLARPLRQGFDHLRQQGLLNAQ